MQGMMNKKVMLLLCTPPSQKNTYSIVVVYRLKSLFFSFDLFVHILPHFTAAAIAADVMCVTQTVNIKPTDGIK